MESKNEGGQRSLPQIWKGHDVLGPTSDCLAMFRLLLPSEGWCLRSYLKFRRRCLRPGLRISDNFQRRHRRILDVVGFFKLSYLTLKFWISKYGLSMKESTDRYCSCNNQMITVESRYGMNNSVWCLQVQVHVIQTSTTFVSWGAVILLEAIMVH